MANKQTHGVINPWFMEQKNFLLLRNWVRIVPIFFRLFSQLFFCVRLKGSIEVKTLPFFSDFAFFTLNI